VYFHRIIRESGPTPTKTFSKKKKKKKTFAEKPAHLKLVCALARKKSKSALAKPVFPPNHIQDPPGLSLLASGTESKFSLKRRSPRRASKTLAAQCLVFFDGCKKKKQTPGEAFPAANFGRSIPPIQIKAKPEYERQITFAYRVPVHRRPIAPVVNNRYASNRERVPPAVVEIESGGQDRRKYGSGAGLAFRDPGFSEKNWSVKFPESNFFFRFPSRKTWWLKVPPRPDVVRL